MSERSTSTSACRLRYCPLIVRTHQSVAADLLCGWLGAHGKVDLIHFICVPTRVRVPARRRIRFRKRRGVGARHRRPAPRMRTCDCSLSRKTWDVAALGKYGPWVSTVLSPPVDQGLVGLLRPIWRPAPPKVGLAATRSAINRRRWRALGTADFIGSVHDF